jgi:hypothetical protein
MACRATMPRTSTLSRAPTLPPTLVVSAMPCVPVALRAVLLRRRGLACAVLAIGLVVGNLAQAFTLDALLRLPLEQLLELKVSDHRAEPPRVAVAAPRGRP